MGRRKMAGFAEKGGSCSAQLEVGSFGDDGGEGGVFGESLPRSLLNQFIVIDYWI